MNFNSKHLREFVCLFVCLFFSFSSFQTFSHGVQTHYFRSRSLFHDLSWSDSILEFLLFKDKMGFDVCFSCFSSWGMVNDCWILGCWSLCKLPPLPLWEQWLSKSTPLKLNNKIIDKGVIFKVHIPWFMFGVSIHQFVAKCVKTLTPVWRHEF